MFICYLFRDVLEKRKLGAGPKISQKRGVRILFFNARLENSLCKGSRDTDRQQRGINQIHNTEPNSRKNLLKEAVRKAVKGAERRPQFLYYIS